MRYRKLGRTGLEVSELGFGAWGISGQAWIGADDAESLRALRLAIEHGVNFLDTAYAYGDGHSEELVGAAVRDSAEAVYVASKVPPKNMEWPARARRCAQRRSFPADWIVACTERQPAEPRPRDDRRPAAPRLVRRVGRTGRLARRGRATEARGEDPLLRRLDQRPPARERDPARRVGARRHRSGDLQRLRPEPGGRALPRSRSGGRRRDRAGAVRRGRADRFRPARDDVPGGRLPERLLRRRAQARSVGPRAGDRPRPRRRGRASWRSSRSGSVSVTRRRASSSPACARHATSSETCAPPLPAH